MKQPSERTRLIIRQLQALLAENAAPYRNWEQPDLSKAIELIGLISASGESSSARYLLPFVLFSEKAIAQSACDGIEYLLRGMSALHLLQLDAVMRGGLYSLRPHLSAWDEMKASDLDNLAVNNNRIGVLALASFHRNGYVREAALRLLVSSGNGEELPFLLIRLSDWVGQIRMLAEQAVEQRIDPSYLHHFVNALALLELIGQRKRDLSIAKRSEIIGRINSNLKQTQNQKFLLEGLRNEDYTVRRACLNLIMDSPHINMAEVVNQVITDSDVCIRRSAIELSTKLSAQHQLSTLRILAVDKAPSIRREALRALCQINSDMGKELLEAAFMDRSAIVRDYARWKMAKLDKDFNFRDFYLEQLSCGKNGSQVAAAVMGLGEVGIPIDAQIIQNFFDHPEVRVRKAVIYAISKLDAGTYVPMFLTKLASDVPSVSRAAQHALERTSGIVSSDSLWRVFTTSSNRWAKLNVLHLINRINKWDRINYMLLAASENEPRVRELATEFITSWESQYRTTWQYTKPNQEQREKFVSGMLLVGKSLPEQLGNTLDLCLRSCTER